MLASSTTSNSACLWCYLAEALSQSFIMIVVSEIGEPPFPTPCD